MIAGYCINLKHCSGSTPPSKETVSSPILPRERENTGGCAVGAWAGAGTGRLPPPSWSALPTIPVLQCYREAQETASSPWKRLCANSKLSDLKRVRALPWQEKPLKNPENTGRDIGSALLAEPERDSLALSRLKRLISP